MDKALGSNECLGVTAVKEQFVSKHLYFMQSSLALYVTEKEVDTYES
ncbi:hypothetical protein [Bacillus salipaludis]|uniref:Uncharacterized protein n=1 Tax=Bacillus salipaludis TaxID=2547811 RepID=A0ABW8RBX3_9BACI